MTDGPPSGAFPQAPPAPSLVGQILDGRYRIVKLIGEGGMGEVYAAEHVHIEKKFAIKLLKSEIVSNAEAVTRFRQEARSSSSIGHRNIIAIDDFGQLADGRIYMCMELLAGAALNDMIQHPMGADRLLNILIQTGHGLAAAHAKGIVHRDMKPENIYVSTGPSGEDVPKILDFGIAKVSGNDGQNHLTRTGTIFGTPFYMAPEQALGNPVDARTDIYAMGVIMYECFAGSLPFQGESFMGILTQHITTDAEPVAQRAAKAGRTLPQGLAEVITRCMRKNPAERYATMDELVSDLVAIYRGIAGPGMSTYMEAFPTGSAAHTAQPTPPPYAPTVAAMQTGPTQPQHQSQPNLMPPGMHPQSGPYAGVPYAPLKKSNTGLIIAIIAILAIGGGIAAFVVLGNKNKGTTNNGTGSDAIAQNGGSATSGSATSGSATSGSATSGSATVPTSGSAAIPTSGSATVPTSGSDASGSAATNGNGSGILPPPQTVEVVMEVPNHAQIFDETGKLVGSNGYIARIPAGESHTYTVKFHGFHEKKVVVDGKQTLVTVNLAPIGGTQTTTHTGSSGPATPKMDCTQRVIDPRNKDCQKQFCANHSSDPACAIVD